jgi:DNA-directed RNA polymerase III subunit RPC1
LIENTTRQAYSRAITALCKKTVYCPHCGATNGVVKKVGTLKIMHEQFRAKKTKPEREEWEHGFDEALKDQRDLRPHISKAQDDMNPLRVVNLFKAVKAAVSLFPAPLPPIVHDFDVARRLGL